MPKVLLVQLVASPVCNLTVLPATARETLVHPSAETQGVTLGTIQTLTAVAHLCLIRDRENGINHGYGITSVSYDACKDIGILQLADKEALS